MKRNRERKLETIEEQIPDDSGSDSWSIEWREPNPAERPEGMAVDAESRTIYYDVWESQRDTLDTLSRPDGDITAMLGGYGSGKTVLGARVTLKQAVEHPGSAFLAMGISYSRARNSTYETLFEQLPGERTSLITTDFNGPEQSPLVADYNRSTHRLTLTNDTTITLGSADTWSRHAGDEFGLIWMDEPSHYVVDLHDLLEMMGSRLRGEDGAQTMLWTLTGNGYNDAWQVLEKRETPDGDDLGHDIEVVTASTPDNPYLSEGAIESQQRQFAGTQRESQALHGGFAAAKGLVYPDFERDTHVVEPDAAADMVEGTDEWRIYGYDAGHTDPRVVLEIGKTPLDQLVVLDEFYARSTHVEDAVAWLSGRPTGTIHCEHSPADRQKFRSAGWPEKKAKKAQEPGLSEVRKRFETNDDGEPGLYVSAACENLIRELFGYKQEQIGTSAAEDHACDSLRYAVFTDAAGGTEITYTTRSPAVSSTKRKRSKRSSNVSRTNRRRR